MLFISSLCFLSHTSWVISIIEWSFNILNPWPIRQQVSQKCSWHSKQYLDAITGLLLSLHLTHNSGISFWFSVSTFLTSSSSISKEVTQPFISVPFAGKWFSSLHNGQGSSVGIASLSSTKLDVYFNKHSSQKECAHDGSFLGTVNLSKHTAQIEYNKSASLHAAILNSNFLLQVSVLRECLKSKVHGDLTLFRTQILSAELGCKRCIHSWFSKSRGSSLEIVYSLFYFAVSGSGGMYIHVWCSSRPFVIQVNVRPFQGFWGTGEKGKIFRGTGEQRPKNKGNRGTQAILGNRNIENQHFVFREQGHFSRGTNIPPPSREGLKCV